MIFSLFFVPLSLGGLAQLVILRNQLQIQTESNTRPKNARCNFTLDLASRSLHELYINLFDNATK